MTEQLYCWGGFGPRDKNKWDMPLFLTTLRFASSFFCKEISPKSPGHERAHSQPQPSRLCCLVQLHFSSLGSDTFIFFRNIMIPWTIIYIPHLVCHYVCFRIVARETRTLPLLWECSDSNKALPKYHVLSTDKAGSSKYLFWFILGNTGTTSNSVNNMKCQLGRAEALREFSSSEKLIIQQSDI